MSVSAIIVAGGSGKRMGHPERKQYMKMGGRPILRITLDPFLSCGIITKIFLVIPDEDISFCKNSVISDIKSKTDIVLVKGGKERQDSVYNGLLAVDDREGIVLIHDGVRPFISMEMIGRLTREAQKNGACIPGLPAFDTLKIVTNTGIIEKTVKREGVFLAQTPQAFRYRLIREAHDDAKEKGYLGTDDASLVERMGYQVKVIIGSRNNIKITTKEDLELGEAIMSVVNSNSLET